jgi:hypothetical protein
MDASLTRPYRRNQDSSLDTGLPRLCPSFCAIDRPQAKPFDFFQSAFGKVQSSVAKPSENCKIPSESFNLFPGIGAYQWVTGEWTEKITAEVGLGRMLQRNKGKSVIASREAMTAAPSSPTLVIPSDTEKINDGGVEPVACWGRACSSFLFVFVSKQVKGWRHFDRGLRLCETLDAISARLGGPRAWLREKGNPGVLGPRVLSPGT